jgi:hypothetical protein
MAPGIESIGLKWSACETLNLLLYVLLKNEKNSGKWRRQSGGYRERGGSIVKTRIEGERKVGLLRGRKE